MLIGKQRKSAYSKGDSVPERGVGLPSQIVRDIEAAFKIGNPLPPLALLYATRDRFYRAAVHFAIGRLKKSRGIPEHKYVRWYVHGGPTGWAIDNGPWTDDPCDSTIQLSGTALQHPAAFPPA